MNFAARRSPLRTIYISCIEMLILPADQLLLSIFTLNINSMRSFFIFCTLFFSAFSNAQDSLCKRIVYPYRVLAAGIFESQGKTDTVVVLDPGEAKLVQVIVPDGKEHPVVQPVDNEPAFIKWNGGKRVLKEEERVLGIGNNHILIQYRTNTESVIQSFILENSQLKKVGEIQTPHIDYGDYVESICSPDGRLFTMSYRNKFAYETNNKLEMFDEELKPVMSYQFKYGLRIGYYFANKDSLCLYEAEPSTRKIYLQLFSINQKRTVFEKESIYLQEFLGLPQVFPVITSDGYILVVNKKGKWQTYLTGVLFTGDTIWNTVIDGNTQQAVYVASIGHVKLFSKVPKDNLSPYMYTLSVKDGSVLQKQSAVQSFMTGVVRRANGDFLASDFKSPNRLMNGSSILPLYCYTMAANQIKSMTFLAIGANEVRLLGPTIEVGLEYSFYTRPEYSIITVGQELWILK